MSGIWIAPWPADFDDISTAPFAIRVMTPRRYSIRDSRHDPSTLFQRQKRVVLSARLWENRE